MSFPAFPAGPKSFEQFVTEAFVWQFGSALQLSAGQEALAHRMEQIMATVAELQAALDRNTASVESLKTSVEHEIEQLRAALEQLSTQQPPTQAQLDQLSDATDALDAATAALGADDAPAA